MRYIIYTRVSTNRQTIENQLKECRDYVSSIMKKGDEVIEFSEPDTSTRKPMNKRIKLVEMMASLRETDKLIVYKVDRLARSPQELINIYFNIRKQGVVIHGLRDSHVDDQNICIYAFIACTERENIRVRTLSGLNRKRSNMERVGSTWYGYKLDETRVSTKVGAKSEGKPFMLLVNEEEQKHIDLMIECQQIGMSYQEIANELAAKGYKNRSGNDFHKMSVYRILKRLGKLHPTPKERLLQMCHESKLYSSAQDDRVLQHSLG